MTVRIRPGGFVNVNTGISIDTDYILSFHFKGNDGRTGSIEVYLDGSLIGTEWIGITLRP